MEEEDSHLLEREDTILLASGEASLLLPVDKAPDSQPRVTSTKQHNSLGARELTNEERQLLQKQDSRIVTEFKQKKLETEAQKNWDLFYKRNTTKFFKDRHWTTREFQELCGDKMESPLKLLEVGCGVGNFMFPLMEELDNVYFYACDFSPRAVEFVKDSPQYNPDRCCAFHCDLTKTPLTTYIKHNEVDLVSMIFVLSAIHPTKMFQALRNIHSVLKPGGLLLFRDYGLHDHAQLRFSPGHKLSENFYFRQDGTRAYYFSTERLAKLVTDAGFEVSSNEYILRETVNKKEGLCVPRVFVQGRFTKKEASHTIVYPINLKMSQDLNNSNNELSGNNTKMGTVS